MRLLTIAIPVFNSHAELASQLDNICRQAKGKNVKVLVVDNASCPPIETVVPFAKEISFLEITRNQQNLGIDQNILRCLELADTQWVWTLSVNDHITPNALDCVLDYIKESPDDCFINFVSASRERTRGLVEFCEHFVYWGTFACSHTCFNVHVLKQHFDYYRKYVETHQGQLFILLKHLAENHDAACRFRSLPLFKSTDPSSWSKAAYVFDTLSVVAILTCEFAEQMPLIRSSLIRKIVQMQMGHLLNARAYEGMQFFSYCILVCKVMKNATLANWVDARLPLLLVVLIAPWLYRIIRRVVGKCSYPVSTKSRTLVWNH